MRRHRVLPASRGSLRGFISISSRDKGLLADPYTRWWLVLRCRTRKGQQSGRLTARIAVEAGIALRRKAWYGPATRTIEHRW